MTTILSPGSCGMGEGSCLSPWRPHFRGQCGSRCSCQAWLGFGPRPALGMRQDVAPPCREAQVPGFWAGGCGHSYNPQLTPYRLLEPVPRGFRRVGSMNGALWPATALRKALGCCMCDGRQGILPPCIRPQQDMIKSADSNQLYGPLAVCPPDSLEGLQQGLPSQLLLWGHRMWP